MSSYSKAGWHNIDGVRVHTDSMLEASVIGRLVHHGFSGKWRRERRGISFGGFHYTPDVELSVDIEGRPGLAIAEIKPVSVTEFDKKSRRRMVGAAKFYRFPTVELLFVDQKHQWYLINKTSGSLTRCDPPKPGVTPIASVPRPLSVPIFNVFWRPYKGRAEIVGADLLADFLEGVINLFLRPAPKRRYRHK